MNFTQITSFYWKFPINSQHITQVDRSQLPPGHLFWQAVVSAPTDGHVDFPPTSFVKWLQCEFCSRFSNNVSTAARLFLNLIHSVSQTVLQPIIYVEWIGKNSSGMWMEPKADGEENYCSRIYLCWCRLGQAGRVCDWDCDTHTYTRTHIHTYTQGNDNQLAMQNIIFHPYTHSTKTLNFWFLKRHKVNLSARPSCTCTGLLHTSVFFPAA